MKRLLVISALILLVAGCRNFNTVDQLQPRPGAEGDSITILAPLSTGLTRTMLQKDNYVYNVYWVLNDAIGVFSSSTNNAEFTLNKKHGGAVAFQGVMAETPQCAYYPYSSSAGNNAASVSLNLPSIQEQTGENPNMAYDVKSGVKTGGDLDEGYIFEFEQKLTLLHFIITPDVTLGGDKLQSVSLKVDNAKLAGPYTLDITDNNNQPSFTEGCLDSVAVVLTNKPTLSNSTPIDVWMFINPDIKNGDNILITITTNRHQVTSATATASSDFVRGAIYEIEMDVDALDAKLTTVAWYDLVTELGLYSLPLGGETHQYREYEDQYVYQTLNAGNHVFAVQGMKNGKLSRLTTSATADLSSGNPFSATLYTIHGAEGPVSTDGSWRVVKRDAGNHKYWLEKADGSQGFILITED